MKKITVILIAVLLVVCMAACGNMSWGLGNFQFNGIHYADFSGNVKDFTVEKWYDHENGIEVSTKEAGSVFFSEGTYILYEDKCPVCGGGE